VQDFVRLGLGRCWRRHTQNTALRVTASCVWRQTWAPRGETPLVTFPANWSKLSTIGTITSDERFFQNTQQGAICSPDVIRFLSHLLDHVVGTVVVENTGIHRSRAVQTFVALHERLSLISLPPYAPELNPIELVWAYIKRNVLGNCCLRTVKELRVQLMKAWRRVRYIRLPQRPMDANLR